MPRASLAFLALSLAALVAPLHAAEPGHAGAPTRTTREVKAPTEAQKAAATAADAAATPPPIDPSKLGQSLDRVVAIVNDGVVTESELNDQIAQITERLKQQNVKLPAADVLRSQVLERLVVQEVQMQRADRVGIKVSDEQLNATVADIAKQNNLTLAQLPAALSAQGVDYPAFRDGTRKEMILATLRQREVLSKINVTPRELDQFMEHLKKLPGENDEYDVSDILIAIPSEANQAKVDELAQKAQEVYERAANEDFARLAVAYSNSQTALEGGALGWRKGPDLPTVLAETIVALKPGQVSKPLTTANGFHIVKLNAIRTSTGDPVQDQVHVRHILVKTNTLQDDATVKLKLAGVRQKILEGQDFGPFASTMSEDPGSAVNGGEMDWTSPNTFVPEFAAQVAQLKDGEISQPFQSQFGWHIVQLLGRRKFDTTEDSLRDRAFRQLRESKADEETEDWVRKLRDEAYIDTSL
ncbi:MAG: peptidylprolyl isomerase [Pseudomonadota bacterium]